MKRKVGPLVDGVRQGVPRTRPTGDPGGLFSDEDREVSAPEAPSGPDSGTDPVRDNLFDVL